MQSFQLVFGDKYLPQHDKQVRKSVTGMIKGNYATEIYSNLNNFENSMQLRLLILLSLKYCIKQIK